MTLPSDDEKEPAYRIQLPMSRSRLPVKSVGRSPLSSNLIVIAVMAKLPNTNMLLNQFTMDSSTS